jgi:hypothetical protein
MNTYKKNAIVIGALFIITMLAGMVDAYFVAPDLNNPLTYIHQIESKILIGMFSILVMAIGIVFIAIAFFPIVKKHSEPIALTYVIFRAIECILLIVGPISYLFLISLSGEYINVEIPDSSFFSTAAVLAIKIQYHAYQLAMIVLGLGSLFLCYSLYESKIIPRFLSIWGFIGYALLLLSAVLDICGLIDTTNGLGAVLYVPGGLWEFIVFPLWLFIKGFNMSFIDSNISV